jgi:hypothetical protein
MNNIVGIPIFINKFLAKGTAYLIDTEIPNRVESKIKTKKEGN